MGDRHADPRRDEQRACAAVGHEGVLLVRRAADAVHHAVCPFGQIHPCFSAGDSLIVALEPGLFTSPNELPAFATQFSYARRHSEWATRAALGLPGSGRAASLLALRPGSYHALTLIGKFVQGRDLYRYKVADASPSGWMWRTPVKLCRVETTIS